LLSLRPATFAGDVSYSLYLWHSSRDRTGLSPRSRSGLTHAPTGFARSGRSAGSRQLLHRRTTPAVVHVLDGSRRPSLALGGLGVLTVVTLSQLSLASRWQRRVYRRPRSTRSERTERPDRRGAPCHVATDAHRSRPLVDARRDGFRLRSPAGSLFQRPRSVWTCHRAPLVI
jgi:hypothetical protein